MEKISKAQIKLVRSLQQKKFRDETGLFVAEGAKCVEELRKGFALEYLYEEGRNASRTEIEQMSGLRTPQGVIAVFKQREPSPLTAQRSPITDNRSPLTAQRSPITDNRSPLLLSLDGIQDPGNLGTIIRTCDWFGVRDIVCSHDTVDCYNPKVVQATMGALTRVRIHYTDLPKWLQEFSAQHNTAIYGTLLEGRDMYEVLQSEGRLAAKRSVIIMGNEGNGISHPVRPLITHPIRIPAWPANEEASDRIESLNVSIATAIVLAEFRRPVNQSCE